jgi:hypothetical protein
MTSRRTQPTFTSLITSAARTTKVFFKRCLAASFKLLDMVMEWTIKENGQCKDFTFKSKVMLIDTKPLTFPDFLNSDTHLRAILISLYKSLVSYRNALTHGKWGSNVSGDLRFDFHKSGQHFNQAITFEEILHFAESMSLLGDLLVTPP